jgi:hypothetical protein
MREILFRGKRKDNGEWVYGFYRSYIYRKKKHAWLETIDRIWEVKPETVGQYTGLEDINGVKIFEGDIVRYGDFGRIPEPDISMDKVVWENGGFIIGGEYMGLSYSVEIEIIGNIHDNPELLDRE